MSEHLLSQWHATWQQLTAAGATYEVVIPQDGSPRYFSGAPADLIEAVQAGRQFSERPFLVWQEQRLGYAEFYHAADQLTAHLVRTLGVQPGERVAIAMRNRPEWVIAFVALVQAGAIPVPLNSWGLRDELLAALEDSEPRWLIADDARLKQVADRLPAMGIDVLAVEAADVPMEARWLRWEVLFQEAVESVPLARVRPEDTALILYTSGTTNRAKGVVSSHRAICQALYAFEFQGVFNAMTSPERIRPLLESGLQPGALLVVPLFHVSGLYAHFLHVLRAGRRLVMMYKWNAAQALDLIERERCTQFNGPPVMMQQLLALPRFHEASTDLIGLGLGGSATGTALLDTMLASKPSAMFGVGYGMTESNAIGTTLAGEQFMFRPDAVGWPLPVVEIRIGEDVHHPVPDGQEGPIWLRSSTLMQGYWKRPQESAESLRDGWLYCGDVGVIDEQGFLHITDRIKDMVIRGGENISSAEVEDCALLHPAVCEAAVVALPDPAYGECVALIGTRVPGMTVREDELRQFMAARLAAYKVPVQILLRDEELPRNSSGKVLKHTLKSAFDVEMDDVANA